MYISTYGNRRCHGGITQESLSTKQNLSEVAAMTISPVHDWLRSISRPAMLVLADGLRSGRLGPSVSEAILANWIGDQHYAAAQALNALFQSGMTPAQAALTLQLLGEERAAAQQASDRVQLVWSPPELDRVDARDTAVVVQELFRTARHSILLATYALDKGEKAAALLGPLAARMDAEPTLVVTVVANLHIKQGSTDDLPSLVRQFAKDLREKIWPGNRLPNVYIDPRAANADRRRRYALHAKCIVADERWSLLTSANFTEAAHDRNIEAGLLVDDAALAKRLARQFRTLIEDGSLICVPDC